MVRAWAPGKVLDVGCGCGQFSRKLAEWAPLVVAVDPRSGGAEWRELQGTSEVRFCRMDGVRLGFPDESFPLVVERAALHHVRSWPEMIQEMIRVSSGHVIMVEPLDDLRSAAKRRSFEAQGLLLEVQAEAGHAHYRHLAADAIASVVKRSGVSVEMHTDRFDDPRPFEEFFDGFAEFASRSARPAYWQAKLEAMRLRFGGEDLCEDDVLTVVVTKRSSETGEPAPRMLIRRAGPADAPALARIHVDSWRAAYRGLVPDSRLDALDYERRAGQFAEWLDTGQQETYLAERDGNVLGILTIGSSRDEDAGEETTGEIWGIYLAPGHWRQGIGTALCRHGERVLAGRGCRSATLWVFAGHARARRFYEAMGFRADGASKTLHLGAPLEAIRYRKEIGR